MYRLLSYPIHDAAPGWPGNPKVKVEPQEALSHGDPANMSTIVLFNHFGSHMDGPKHFNDRGPNLHQLPLHTFIYERPFLLDLPKSFGELIRKEELEQAQDDILQADLLIIRSGFAAERSRDPERYAAEGVGISSEACRYLIETFDRLKAIAIDWISLASYAHLADGILAHEYLLGKYHAGKYICIIEDLNFHELRSGELRKVFALPLLVEGIDSAPVTVVAECDN